MYVPLHVPNKHFKLFGVESEEKKKKKYKWHSISEKVKISDFMEGSPDRARNHNATTLLKDYQIIKSAAAGKT